MTKNVGQADHVIRLVVGIALLSLYFFLPGNQRFFAFIGLIPLATGGSEEHTSELQSH